MFSKVQPNLHARLRSDSLAPMESEHYFSASPSSSFTPKTIRVTLQGREVELTTAGGTFSPDRLDAGTGVLLANVPPPAPGGNLLDIGCGWGPITLSLALASPHATVWAVDVNQRSLELTRQNAAALGLENVRACTPDEVPDDIVFRTIWSNPPIRVGKNELHGLLSSWLPRLDERSDAWLVVARNLGSDSLQRWLSATLPKHFTVSRAATGKGYRVLRVRHHQATDTGTIITE